jgi:hypothetical protein
VGIWPSGRYRRDVMRKLFHGDVHGVVMTKHHIGHRVTDQDQVNTRV